MLRVTGSGEIVDDSGRRRYHLTEREQDALVSSLYPDEPELWDEATRRHRAVSYSGCHYDFSNRPSDWTHADSCEEDCRVGETVYAVGGPRLHALWQTCFRYDLAAADLGMNEAALRKWFYRWRASSPRSVEVLRELLT